TLHCGACSGATVWKSANKECQEITRLGPWLEGSSETGLPGNSRPLAYRHRLRALVLCDGSRCQLSRCRCMVDKRLVTKRPPKLQPTWSATSTTNIASFDRTAVLQLLHHRLRRPFNDILHPRDAFPQPATTCVRSAARRHWIHDLHDPGAAGKLRANRAPGRTAGIHAVQRCGAPGGPGKRRTSLRLPPAQASLLRQIHDGGGSLRPHVLRAVDDHGRSPAS